jgi:small multidrug resistance pump
MLLLRSRRWRAILQGGDFMHWIYLALAILMEVLGTTCMKLSEGFSKLVPSVMVFVLYGACFSLMILALKRIDLSVTYAIWSGLGTALIAVIGIVYFQESVSLLKVASIVFIVLGVAGLHLSELAGGVG